MLNSKYLDSMIDSDNMTSEFGVVTPQTTQITQQQNEIRCPKCASTQLSANKKGFSVGKAAAGVLLTGGIGLIAGAHGSGNVEITCLNCGNRFNVGQGA